MITQENIKDYAGNTVQVSVDGKEEFADLHVDEAGKPYITIPKQVVWTDMSRYYLSEDEVSSLIPNGPNNLFSKIALPKPTER